MSTEQFNVVVNQPMQLGECPLWHPLERALYWIDIDGHAVHRFNPTDKTHRSWPMPSEPGCIAWGHAGGMLIALRTGLVRLDTESGVLTLLAEAPYSQSSQRFNDGRCDAQGRLWVGGIHEPRDRPGATLYCIDHGQIRDAEIPVVTSNGIAFSPDNRTLYHADTRGHKITAYVFDVTTGTVGEGRLLRQFSDDRGKEYGGRPDGACVDSEGAYWVAMYEGGAIVRLSEQGEVLQTIHTPFLCPTMACLGGEDLKTLYITSARKGRSDEELARYPLSGYVVSTQISVPGLPEHPYHG